MTEREPSLPPFTEAEEAELAAAIMQDFGTSAEQSAMTAVPVDWDVVEAFKATGPGWQTRINDILRRAAKRLGAR